MAFDMRCSSSLKVQFERILILKSPRLVIVAAANAVQVPALDRVLVVAPQFFLGRASDVDGGERQIRTRGQQIPGVFVAVKPEVDAALGGHLADVLPILEPMPARLGDTTAGEERIVAHDDARAGVELRQESLEPFELSMADLAGRIPREDVGTRRIQRDEPDVTNLFREGVGMLWIDAFALLPSRICAASENCPRLRR